LMGSSFKVLGGRGASSMFTAVDNPISGLMTGILGTVLVQSSSTSTSIVVAMVGEGAITVRNGIPIIMGANIGTSVTNTIVSLGQVGNRIELERAFAGATVHDMFNMLSVLVLLPIESIFAAAQGEGGPLYWLTKEITTSLMGSDKRDPLFESPVKTITKPIVDGILKANKYVIYALTLGPPVPRTPSQVNTTLCGTRRLSSFEQTTEDFAEDAVPGSFASVDSAQAPQRALLSRRMSPSGDCSAYFCLSSSQDKNFKKISKSSHKKLTECGDSILDDDSKPCGKDKCYLDADEFYQKKVERGQLIKGGFLQGAGDSAGGVLGLIISILLLCLGLFGLCKALQAIFMGNAKKILQYSTRLNPYVAIAVGIAITIIVQSSSVTTSALTPLCGIGVLPLDKMLPLTLGANIGTTMTAMLASLVSLKYNAVQIAFCHLCFNIVGILIWFPIPPMRRVPLGGAKLLGLYASFYRFFPVLYLLVAFVLVPGVCLGVSAIFSASIAGGIIVLLFLLAALGLFEYIWLVGIRGDPLLQGLVQGAARGGPHCIGAGKCRGHR